MSKRLLLDVSPTGVQHSIEIDHDGDSFTAIEFTPTHVEDEILDECAKLRGLAQTKGRAFQLAAKIPFNTYIAWKKEWREKYVDTWTWPTFEAMKLNNRDYGKMRAGYKRSGVGMKL